MLEGIIKKIQGSKVLMETSQGIVELPLATFEQVPHPEEKFFIFVSMENSTTKRVINELLN